MKRRRNLVLAILLIASMVLSIGYAAMTDDLFIKGGSEAAYEEMIEEFNADVQFLTYEISDDSKATAKIENDANGGEKDLASFYVDGLSDLRDSVTITYTIQNKSEDLAAMVTIADNFKDGFKVTGTAKDNPNAKASDYFTVTHNWPAEGKEIAAGDTATITVTVTMIQRPVDTLVFEDAYEFQLLATAVEK